MNAIVEAARIAFRAQATTRREREREFERTLSALHAIALVSAESVLDLQGLLAASVDWPTDRIRKALALTLHGLQEQLEDRGVALDGEAGEVLDSSRHQIVAKRHTDGVAGDRVVEVVRRGVTCSGRRLRAAGVVISAGGPNGGADRH